MSLWEKVWGARRGIRDALLSGAVVAGLAWGSNDRDPKRSAALRMYRQTPNNLSLYSSDLSRHLCAMEDAHGKRSVYELTDSGIRNITPLGIEEMASLVSLDGKSVITQSFDGSSCALSNLEKGTRKELKNPDGSSKVFSEKYLLLNSHETDGAKGRLIRLDDGEIVRSTKEISNAYLIGTDLFLAQHADDSIAILGPNHTRQIGANLGKLEDVIRHGPRSFALFSKESSMAVYEICANGLEMRQNISPRPACASISSDGKQIWYAEKNVLAKRIGDSIKRENLPGRILSILHNPINHDAVVLIKKWDTHMNEILIYENEGAIRRLTPLHHDERPYKWLDGRNLAVLCGSHIDNRDGLIYSIDIVNGKHTQLTPKTVKIPPPWKQILPTIMIALSAGYLLRSNRRADTRDALSAECLERTLSLPIDVITDHPLTSALCFGGYLSLGLFRRAIEISSASPVFALEITIPALAYGLAGAYLIHPMLMFGANCRKPRLTIFLHIWKRAFKKDKSGIPTSNELMNVPDEMRPYLTETVADTNELPDIEAYERSFRHGFDGSTLVNKTTDIFFNLINRRGINLARKPDLHNLLAAQYTAVMGNSLPDIRKYTDQLILLMGHSTEAYLIEGAVMAKYDEQYSNTLLGIAAVKIAANSEFACDSLSECSHRVAQYTSKKGASFMLKEMASMDEACRELMLSKHYHHNEFRNGKVVRPINVIQGKSPLLLTHFENGKTMYEMIQSRQVGDEYNRISLFLAELHSLPVPGVKPRDISESYHRRIDGLEINRDINAQTKRMSSYIIEQLMKCPPAPNQDAHPMNFILGEKPVKIDMQNAYETLPATCDIANLLLFDQDIDYKIVMDAAKNHHEMFCPEIRSDDYLQSLQGAIHYRAVALCGAWSSPNRESMRPKRREVLHNGARIISMISDEDAYAGNLQVIALELEKDHEPS